MARKENSILGVDLREQEIRVALVKFNGGRAVSAKTATAPMPTGAMGQGMVYETGTVAIALRRLLDTLDGAASARVVFGVPGEHTFIRTLFVPPCPPEELPSIVASEVEHQMIVRSEGATYDFLRLDSVETSDTPSTAVVVIGAEAEATESLIGVAERAGLNVHAFEPQSVAMLRTAAVNLPVDGNSFVLVVGLVYTDVAFFVSGKLAAVRRLDIGTNSLIQSVMPSSTYAESSVSHWEEATEMGEMVHLDQASIDRLSVEIVRTFDYLTREDPEGRAVDRIWLAVDEFRLSGLADRLAERIGIPVQLVVPPLEDQVEDPFKFLAPYGLAASTVGNPGVPLPRVDLFSARRSEVQMGESKRNMLGSALVAAASLLVATIGCVLYNGQINRLDKELKSIATQSTALRTEAATLAAERAKKALQYQVLCKEGVPLGSIMDYLVASVRPGVGLKSVAIGADLKVGIVGEALNEVDLLATTSDLQRSPVVTSLMVNRFSRPTDRRSNLLTFELSAQTVTADHVHFSDEKGAEAKTSSTPLTGVQ